MRTALTLAAFLAGTFAASAQAPAPMGVDAVQGPDAPLVRVADTTGSPDAIQAPGPLGSGPGDVATPPTPFPFPGFRGDLPHARTAPAPSIALSGDVTQTVRGPTADGHAETAAGGPLGDLALVRRIVQGGSEEPSPGPLDGRPGYRDLVGHLFDEAAKQALPAELPPGARRDVPAEGYMATIAKVPPPPVAKPPMPDSHYVFAAAGDPCRFERGGTVEVVGRDPDLGTLVRYVTDGWGRPGSCERGTLAFVPARAVSGWPASGDVLANAKAMGERATAAADRILAGRDTPR